MTLYHALFTQKEERQTNHVVGRTKLYINLAIYNEARRDEMAGPRGLVACCHAFTCVDNIQEWLLSWCGGPACGRDSVGIYRAGAGHAQRSWYFQEWPCLWPWQSWYLQDIAQTYQLLRTDVHRCPRITNVLARTPYSWEKQRGWVSVN